MPKYRITTRANDATNNLMEATQDIMAGDKIFTEDPLVDLPVSLVSAHDPNQWLDPCQVFNGRRDLEEERSRLSQDKRDKLDALYNMEPDHGILTLFATNCFTESIIDKDGRNKMVVRIYEKISRVNHSCRPNAAVSWHPTTEKASLRALRRIPNGTEITICYYAEEQTSLMSRTDRRFALTKGFKFTCRCEMCSLPPGEYRKNDTLRRNDLKAFNKLQEPEGPSVFWRDVNNSKAARIKIANEYINYLDQLHVVDFKLAEAYKRLAMLQPEMFEVAEDIVQNNLLGGGQHCNGCGNQPNIRYHLDMAWQAIGETHSITMRVHGTSHPYTQEIQKLMNKISKERNRLL